MTQFNGQIDAPPDEYIAGRFSEPFADALVAWRASPDPANTEAMKVTLSEITAETVEEVINDRRARIAEALATLSEEFPKLADDLGFREWRNNPTYIYKLKSLLASRRRAKNIMHPRELIDDLAAICLSETGTSQRDNPHAQPQLRIEDFAQRPRITMRESDYHASAPGYETPDSGARVMGGREAA